MRRVGGDEATGGLDEVAGHAGLLIVLGDGLPDMDAGFGREAELYCYLGAHPTAAAASADFVLPVTTFAEQEGTFTNHEGRVQRFWPGLAGPGAARPPWMVLSAIAKRLGDVDAPTRADLAFLRAAEMAPEFQGLSFEVLGTRGALVNEPIALPGS